MGKRKYPPLTPSEVKSIVGALGFKFRRKDGSHAQYERLATGKYPRSIVTIDEHYSEFDDDLIKNMIRQSNHSRDEFYGATKSTARKGGVKLYQYVEPQTKPEKPKAESSEQTKPAQ